MNLASHHWDLPSSSVLVWFSEALSNSHEGLDALNSCHWALKVFGASQVFSTSQDQALHCECPPHISLPIITSPSQAQPWLWSTLVALRAEAKCSPLCNKDPSWFGGRLFSYWTPPPSQGSLSSLEGEKSGKMKEKKKKSSLAKEKNPCQAWKLNDLQPKAQGDASQLSLALAGLRCLILGTALGSAVFPCSQAEIHCLFPSRCLLLKRKRKWGKPLTWRFWPLVLGIIHLVIRKASLLSIHGTPAHCRA